MSRRDMTFGSTDENFRSARCARGLRGCKGSLVNAPNDVPSKAFTNSFFTISPWHARRRVEQRRAVTALGASPLRRRRRGLRQSIQYGYGCCSWCRSIYVDDVRWFIAAVTAVHDGHALMLSHPLRSLRRGALSMSLLNHPGTQLFMPFAPASTDRSDVCEQECLSYHLDAHIQAATMDFCAGLCAWI